MKTYWILTRLNDEGCLVRDRFDDEDDARAAWYRTPQSLFLDEVTRHESRL
jgi:hypothetical protein